MSSFNKSSYYDESLEIPFGVSFFLFGCTTASSFYHVYVKKRPGLALSTGLVRTRHLNLIINILHWIVFIPGLHTSKYGDIPSNCVWFLIFLQTIFVSENILTVCWTIRKFYFS